MLAETITFNDGTVEVVEFGTVESIGFCYGHKCSTCDAPSCESVWRRDRGSVLACSTHSIATVSTTRV